MKICGYNKTTLLDYPGRVACTVFLGGCNFRCPFCQNGGLVLEPGLQPEYSQEEILAFLKKRRGILDGVCITGGEPTISGELPHFLEKIKDLGYAVKLDTNGTNPEMVRMLVREGLIDMAAMDIKASKERYPILAGVQEPGIDRICETADYLMHGGIAYEFRTTVVRELHSEEDFQKIGEWLKGAEAYYLQAYKDSAGVLRPGFSSYTFEELDGFRKILQKDIRSVGIRGID